MDVRLRHAQSITERQTRHVRDSLMGTLRLRPSFRPALQIVPQHASPHVRLKLRPDPPDAPFRHLVLSAPRVTYIYPQFSIVHYSIAGADANSFESIAEKIPKTHGSPRLSAKYFFCSRGTFTARWVVQPFHRAVLPRFPWWFFPPLHLCIFRQLAEMTAVN